MKKFNRWCVVATHWEHIYFDEGSISDTRTIAISKFMKDNDFKSWRSYKKMGWKCVKVQMTLEVI